MAMGRTLIGAQGSMKFTDMQYGLAMKLVYDMGWKPLGTLAPESYEREDGPVDELGQRLKWPAMNYFANAGQRVSDADALALAEKLEDVMLDVPSHDATMHKVHQVIILPPLGEMRILKPGSKVNVLEFFSGRNKAVLAKYAAFARQGGFKIT